VRKSLTTNLDRSQKRKRYGSFIPDFVTRKWKRSLEKTVNKNSAGASKLFAFTPKRSGILSI
jgi:hypothetical protein